ncbi:hypothetical protein AB833_06235 [Chromatiales bacterium (ex Bugula neritina AB1)]|nr:hypothetical protein AB833_06235 [Chromatiales bacterium (ex Bugula neritina AB1)]
MITLYYAPDNASLIIRIILEELQVPYETVLVDRSSCQQNSAEYSKLNPKQLIPVCLLNGEPVFETAAIALALAEQHQSAPGTELAPTVDNTARPQFLKWLFFMSNTLHPDLRLLFYPEKYVGHNEAEVSRFREATRQRLLDSFTILNTHYSGVSSDYLFGDSPCIVDIYMAVCMRWAQLYPASSPGQIRCDDYPALKRFMQKLEIRHAVVKACEAEGISGLLFSEPGYADPPEGSAT